MSEEFVFFWGKDNPNGYLSQFYPAPFTFGGAVYPTAEHWFMFNKALLFDDKLAMMDIWNAKHPYEAKKIGRRVKNFNEEEWHKVSSHVARLGNIMKFMAHESLFLDLLRTNNKILVEASPVDKIWGIGLGKDDPRALDKDQWLGENRLGQVLMEVRSHLQMIDIISTNNGKFDPLLYERYDRG